MGLSWIPWRGDPITFYLWCAVGALAGGLAGVLMGSRGTILRLEEVGVGMFGAFVGGEFVASFIAGPPQAAGAFRPVALLTAVGGALVTLLVLRAMRKAVGPLRSGKSIARKR